ncbi:MAG TPA: SDR family oxidoreductase [Stackebrandtia sp.]|jgi:uncharacterized protein YbjT (DUF2867 family)|uniref:SDR family oxidoreductase n=1 Tax=Stackebrandtia sp. TaxID=2023065 RepID=UPI002D285A26|nr:SDR family oxidoreductase [Stackebrandtia sp.]HZE37932.1 SDR family oxidoreductase [Stackebrandtia sp.]
MNTSILITGGTGTLGRLVTPLLRDSGARVRVLSRHAHATTDGVQYVARDLMSGEGIEAAIGDADTVLHLAGGQKRDDVATANLVRAARNTGVKHLVYISVIGAGRVPLGWLDMKHTAEQVVTASGLDYTILRAAQVNDLVLTMWEKMAKLPVVPMPGHIRMQPVDSRDVAARLAELALGPPAGLVPELAGPREYGMDELMRGYLAARGKRRLLMPVRMPGKAGRAYRAGENITVDGVDRGRRSWEDFLAERVA